MKLQSIMIKRIVVFLLVAYMQCVGVASADDFEDAFDAYERGDYATAMRLYQRAAEQGDSVAQNNLGTMYANGKGVAQDYKEAVKWYRLAAQQGYATAQSNLGIMYDHGQGVPQDPKEAIKWYRLAAAQGFAQAQYNLGFKYDKGEGVPQDYVEALRLYRFAAAQGDAFAQSNLSFMYGRGRGVTQDYMRAYMWSSLAAAQGHAIAVTNRDLYVSNLMPKQIAEAQNMAQQCKASNYKQCGEATKIARTLSPQHTPPPKPPESKKSSGTGFYVSSDGYLITNGHVVESCVTINALDGTGQRIPLRVVRVLKPDDLALLKASIAPSSFATFRETGKINQGETVVAYGYPLAGLLASSGNVTTGNVTALAGLRDNARQIQISAPVQPGNSGGPLVDSRGVVIGVIVSKLDAIAVARITSDIPQNINFAIKASSVINLLEAHSVKYRSERLQRDLPIEAITSMLKEYTVKIECN